MVDIIYIIQLPSGWCHVPNTWDLGTPLTKWKFRKPWEGPRFIIRLEVIFMGKKTCFLRYPKFKKHADRYSVRVCHRGMAIYIISKICWSTWYAKTWNERPFRIISVVPNWCEYFEPKVCVCVPDFEGIDAILPLTWHKSMIIHRNCQPMPWRNDDFPYVPHYLLMITPSYPIKLHITYSIATKKDIDRCRNGSIKHYVRNFYLLGGIITMDPNPF